MTVIECRERSSALIARLVTVWEDSVRATHTFLSEEEIGVIKAFVPQALAGVEHLVVLAEDDGTYAGFMGVQDHRLEMLFLTAQTCGKGYGRKLLEEGLARYGVDTLTVNEQNPQAVGFYEHMGFRTYRRTDLDEEGRPYPLLYMVRKDAKA